MSHPQLQDRFRNSVASALAKVGETSPLDHAGLKGHFREIFLRDLIAPILSSDFIAGSGLVVGSTGQTSAEADVVVFDKFHLPPVLYQPTVGYFPIEGVYYYGEIKSKLTMSELRDAQAKFRRFLSMNPMANNHGQKWGPRFIFAWSSDLTGGIEEELTRYLSIDEFGLTDPAASIICIVGKGYCAVLRNPDGSYSWKRIGDTDGFQEVVNFIGGMANSLIDFRMQNFGIKFGAYILPKDSAMLGLHNLHVKGLPIPEAKVGNNPLG